MIRMIRLGGLVAVFSILSLFAAVVHAELPRRGSLGLAAAPASPEGGVLIARLSEGGPAARAGLKADDRLVRIGNAEITSMEQVTAVLNSLKSGRAVEVRVQRGETMIDAVVMPDALARETLDGARVIYDDVKVGQDIRVRTITTIPEQSGPLTRDGLVPGVVILSAASCITIETLIDPNHAYSRLVRRLTDKGFAVLRVEKPGVGDSEGVSCRESGFVEEMGAYFTGFDQFKRRPQVDSERMFAVGISGGGLQAPLLAQGHDIKGIVTFGAVVQPWFDYIVTNFRSRWLRQGIDPSEVDRHMRHVREYFARLLIIGQSPAEIQNDVPQTVEALRSLFGSDLEYFAGRHYTYHQQIDQRNVYGAWGSFGGKLLSVHGEYDWISSMDDHKAASMIVSRKGPGRAEFKVIEGMDHGFTLHDSLAASFEKPAAGKSSDAFHDLAIEWLVEQAASENGAAEEPAAQ